MSDCCAFHRLAKPPHATAVPPINEHTAGEVFSGTQDPLAAAFEEDLAAWLIWLRAVRATRADERAMRWLELAYGAGWLAITASTLAVPLFGTTAAVLSLTLFVATLLVGYLATVPGRDTDECPGCGCPTFGPEERPHLVRIMNLSRIPSHPAIIGMLLCEVDEALSIEPLANWPPLRLLCEELRAHERTWFDPAPLAARQGRTAYWKAPWSA